MDSGLIQFLVIAFFIIISVMDGAARKKRQEAQRRGAELGVPGDGPGSSEGEEVPEGAVPAELWEEIGALARGGPPPGTKRLPSTREPGQQEPSAAAPQVADRSPRPEPSTSARFGATWSPDGNPPVVMTEAPAPVSEQRAVRPPRSAPTRPVAVVRAEGRTAVEVAAHPVPERSEEGYLDRLERAERAEETAEAAAKAARARSRPPPSRDPLVSLRRGGRASLRQAVILSEVLGPPVSTRRSGHQPPD